MTRIVLGKKIREQVYNDLKQRIDSLQFQPVLIDIVVGNDPVSLQYVQVKKGVAESLGIDFRIVALPEDVSTEDVIQAISDASLDVHCCGCIVQLPLPNHIDSSRVLESIPRNLDVDCLHPESELLFYTNEVSLSYPTARSIMSFVEYLDTSKESHIVMVGKGKLVGKPVYHVLKKEGYHVTAVDKETVGKETIIANADVIISATGIAKGIKGEHIKQGSILIDAGTSEMAGAVVGDIDRASVENIAGILIPVPGGVGPLTTLMLCDNVVTVAEKKYELR
ncbi:MAG: bifunctional 5,10-methylenetetrahydrofolate dehydrogenase/5,10-methenyltetrahydrofolate cyclohydrolase [Candidatus Pacebacteria bacterium]|nr:bifunctional 5,10-methylenetetrahydrofolate dehydrogenase/5,10-methenyltetrahydrofolate cyclohydrolase [Candidatus Paceibacterota bacterium]